MAAGGSGGGGAAFGAAGEADLALGRPTDTTGRVASSSDPSAIGKSDGIDARAGAEGGGSGGAAGRAGAGGWGGATPTIVLFIGDGTGGFSAGVASPTPPIIVAFMPRGGPGAAGAGPPSGGEAAGFVTRKECPHFGHRILRPAGGTRRSSIGYAALHDSHSTFSIRGRAYHRAYWTLDRRPIERGGP
jgi:hypothetical protein